MGIAADIKWVHRVDNDGLRGLIEEAEDKAVDIEQDWPHEATEYRFADGTVLRISGPEVSAYECN